MKSRIPELTSPTEEAARVWIRAMHARGLLFCLDDKPEEMQLIASGKPMFTPNECVIVTQYVSTLFDSIGERVHEIAYDTLSETFYTAEERRELEMAYG